MTERLGYIILFGLFGFIMLRVMEPYVNPDPKIIPINEQCSIIEYKNNYFLNCQ